MTEPWPVSGRPRFESACRCVRLHQSAPGIRLGRPFAPVLASGLQSRAAYDSGNTMWTKQVDAYNRHTRRCAMRTDEVFVCYLISERQGSEIVKSAVPRGTVSSLEDARRWVNGEPILIMPVEGGTDVDC